MKIKYLTSLIVLCVLFVSACPPEKTDPLTKGEIVTDTSALSKTPERVAAIVIHNENPGLFVVVKKECAGPEKGLSKQQKEINKKTGITPEKCLSNCRYEIRQLIKNCQNAEKIEAQLLNN